MSNKPTSPTHTPAPWMAKLDQFDFTNDGERYVVFGDPNGDSYGRVALVAPTKERVARGKNKTPYNATDTERDANARLIAAAPELLKALEGLRRAFLNLYGCYPPSHGTGEKYHGAMEDCDAAIRKARGE